MANNKFYGYTPKTSKPPKPVEKTWGGEDEGGNAYEGMSNRLDRVNPYEFRKGMDYELTAIGCARLQESTPEEREKATESVLKNLESMPNHYTSLITYNTLFRNVQGSKPTFNAWLKTQENTKMQEVNRGDKDSKHKDDKMTDKIPKYTKGDYTKKFETKPSPLKESKMEKLKEALKDKKNQEALKKTIKQIIKQKLYEASAKDAAMADMEDSGEAKGGKKGKENSKKEKPIRADRFDKEEEVIKDILFRVDAKGKKPKEEGDYTKDEPAPGSMLDAKDGMLDKYKELKADGNDPKKTLEEYNKLLAEKNEEYKVAIEKYVEEFEGNGITMEVYGEKLSDTIKNLQERLKLGLSQARAGVEEEMRETRREVALTGMTREQHIRLLEIVKENGISLREGTENIKVYYEIAKAAYLEGAADALKL